MDNATPTVVVQFTKEEMDVVEFAAKLDGYDSCESYLKYFALQQAREAHRIAHREQYGAHSTG